MRSTFIGIERPHPDIHRSIHLFSFRGQYNIFENCIGSSGHSERPVG
jgi:hypothetical protein